MSDETKRNDGTVQNEDRRDFIKKATLAGVGLAAGALLGGKSSDVWADGVAPKAMLPDGKLFTRGELLSKLGLNPNTAPEAWINIVNCGGNAAALERNDAVRLERLGKLRGLSPADLGAGLRDLARPR